MGLTKRDAEKYIVTAVSTLKKEADSSATWSELAWQVYRSAPKIWVIESKSNKKIRASFQKAFDQLLKQYEGVDRMNTVNQKPGNGML